MNMKITAVHKLPVSDFTVLELLVVIVIIGLLATDVGPRYFSQFGKIRNGFG